MVFTWRKDGREMLCGVLKIMFGLARSYANAMNLLRNTNYEFTWTTALKIQFHSSSFASLP